MDAAASNGDVDFLVARVRSLGLDAHLSTGSDGRWLIALTGDLGTFDSSILSGLAGVSEVVPTVDKYRLPSRGFQEEDTVIPLGESAIGGPHPFVIAGPCAVESRKQVLEAAHGVKAAGANALRGGAFKPRSSPYSFQGLGWEGLNLLGEAREKTGLPIVTEVMAPEDIPGVAEIADVLQIGARNMQNFPLLRAAGLTDRPVLLKRGLMSTIEELLMSAEYVMLQGNHKVVLCERGIRSFETVTRNTFDINAIPVLKRRSHLPVLADPSHGTGVRELVEPVALAGIAAGADGLIIEVHPDPNTALSDGMQSQTIEQFAHMMRSVGAIAAARDGVVADV